MYPVRDEFRFGVRLSKRVKTTSLQPHEYKRLDHRSADLEGREGEEGGALQPPNVVKTAVGCRLVLGHPNWDDGECRHYLSVVAISTIEKMSRLQECSMK